MGVETPVVLSIPLLTYMRSANFYLKDYLHSMPANGQKTYRKHQAGPLQPETITYI